MILEYFLSINFILIITILFGGLIYFTCQLKYLASAKKRLQEWAAINEELLRQVQEKETIHRQLDQQIHRTQEQNLSFIETQKAVLNVLEDLEEEKNKLDVQFKETEKFKLAVENTSDHIIITDLDGYILYANSAAEEITGYSREEMIGARPSLWGKQMPTKFYQNMWRIIKTEKQPFSVEITNKRKSGEIYVAELHISPILDKKGQILFFLGVERDITKEKEIDRMKSEFISLASHQLRTPLSAMKWFLEMIRAGDAGELSEKQKDFIENVYISNQRMIHLVNSLLNISRIESGRIIIEPQPTDLKALCEGVLSEMEQEIKAREHHVEIVTDPQLPVVNLDPKLIHEAIKNIINNAVKYTPPKGQIKIAIKRTDNEVVFEVKDNGWGIPSAEARRVFTKFFRGITATKQEAEGSGLGLYLTKIIAESSGGKIWFESQEGKGTTFWISLPLGGTPAKEGEVSLT